MFSFIPAPRQSDHWNQPLTDETANKMTDDWVMRDKANCLTAAVRLRTALPASDAVWFQDQNGDGGKL